jgi:NAD(P)-dependent dehydrogenase (short-subunit alcohol dehydrogenase family)
MRILLIGGKGTVGRAIAAHLGRRHDLVIAGRSSGDVKVDIDDEASIRAMFKSLGRVDAIVCAAGSNHFGPLATMTGEQFKMGLLSKLLGQVNVTLIGKEHVNDGGSITLTGGILDREPIRQGANASTVDGALNSFVMAAAIEMPRGIRINIVSPGLLEDSAEAYDGFFPGHEPVSSARVGLGYAKSVEGAITGQVIRVE